MGIIKSPPRNKSPFPVPFVKIKKMMLIPVKREKKAAQTEACKKGNAKLYFKT